jgi:archaellum component FlaC
MENDKFQEFMGDQFAKMFQEIQKVSGELQNVKEDVQGVKDIQLRMENDLNDKIGKVFDFIDAQRDVNKEIVESLNRIEVKVEVLQLETAHIRRVK